MKYKQFSVVEKSIIFGIKLKNRLFGFKIFGIKKAIF